MALPGDARIVIDVPPPHTEDRSATMTVSILGDEREDTFLLDALEESALNLLFAQIMRRHRQ